MADMLDGIAPETAGRSCRQSAAFDRDVPPALDDPKELFVVIRSMVADDCFVANMSRAVVRGINTYEAASPSDWGNALFQEPNSAWKLQVWKSSRIRKACRTSFLENADRLDKRGQTDAALDIIFDQMDEMLLAGEFDQVDRILAEVIPGSFSVELLLGLLTVTLPAKNRLRNRAPFFERVRQSLYERGETDEGLLVGLD